MKRKSLIALFLTLMLVAGVLSACSNDDAKKDNNTNTNTNTNDTPDNAEDKTDDKKEEPVAENLSGTITMSGSTSMEKLANAAAEAFMIENPDVTVTAEFIGSSGGVEAVIAGTVNIGNASRGLKDSEKEAGAIENVVAIDGIGVIVDKANTATNLTKDQLIAIYKGETNNWSQVGGPDQPIVVVGRESGSGTRGAFEEILDIEGAAAYSNEINSTGGVMAKVASTPGAIGYVSLDVIDDSVIAVSLEGVEPTSENIVAGNYFLSRPFVMATKGEISEQSDLVQAFFNYLKTDDGKTLIKNVGLIVVE
ncbi:MAG TPA: phosphate ABC transporter substrate-binding protein [Clostridiales bacterium]|nr:phosphate ABC transporter substrate-binding protein [Clostridiales bacterium]